MSNTDKQWLQQKIAGMEATRDDIPFGLDEDDSNTLAALRIALASLEAEAVAYTDAEELRFPHATSDMWPVPLGHGMDLPLYAAPPAPVSVPDEAYSDDCPDLHPSQPDAWAAGWNACRAAMLQGVEPVTTANKLPEGWVAVPVEPTEDMIVNGFESEPDESFSDEKVWEAYDAMSECQQAAHRAKLCWAAMIKAAPKLKHDLT